MLLFSYVGHHCFIEVSILDNGDEGHHLEMGWIILRLFGGGIRHFARTLEGT